ncbi:MAG: hypothetical protein GY810_19445 [Aureispira sp.]|nr:hypothetical protein [Aureispira sp.]
MKDLFLASYLPVQAGTYFNRVLLVSQLAEVTTDGVPELRDEMFGQLQKVGKNYIQNIQYANHLYTNWGLPPLTLPKYPNDYFLWCSAFVRHLKEIIEPDDPETWIHNYGYNLGDLSTSCWVLQTILTIRKKTNGAFDYAEQIANSIEDIAGIKFRFGAPAMLLTKHDDATYRFMWEHWQTLDGLLQDLIDCNLKEEDFDIDNALLCTNLLISKTGAIMQDVNSKLQETD